MQQQAIIIGTRGSKLALWQANYTQQLLAENNILSEIKIIQTKGDASQTWNTSFDKLEGKGFFTKELEEALLSNEIDLAVHSCKDLPTQFPDGLTIAALSKRANPFDVLLIKKEKVDFTQILSLQQNAIVGTSSSRRKAQLLAFRTDLSLKDIRGNVPTRIEKLSNNEFDAIVLAQAGIDRLQINVDEFEIVPLTAPMFVPAAAQGILAYQIRTNDKNMLKICSILNEETDANLTSIERKILNAFDGGCQIPLGIYTKQEESAIHIWISYANAWNAIPIRMHFSFNHIDAVNVENIVSKVKNHQAKDVFISKEKTNNDYFFTTLEAHGYNVKCQSFLSFQAIDFDINLVQEQDWIFFSSKQAIDYFLQKVDKKLLETKKIAVLGLGTAQHLKQHHIQPNFVGDGLGKTSAALFEKNIQAQTKVLFPSASQSLFQVQKHFINQHIVITNVSVYENQMKDDIQKIEENILVFTSPMNAKAYFSKYSKEAKQTVISIGKTTALQLQEMQIEHKVAYQPYTYALVDEVMSV